MAIASKSDRVLIKGFGMHVEGHGRPAMTLAWCGAALLLIGRLLLWIGGPTAVIALMGAWLARG